MLIGLGDQFFSNAADRVGLGHQGKLMKIYAPIATLVFALIAPINLHANVISILPPPTLTLDSLVISEGVFSITSGTQYLTNGTSSSITLLQNTHNATIGGTEPSAPLFEFNNTAQALQFVGNFDASSPDLPAANFQITLGVSPGLSSMALQSLFTFFLEPDTTNTL
ncbi:MAG: hypothetical protein HOK82_21260, partial [Rhodospirillaceae bacterium]|nr:hypothetical protein [Rhodospirillaceae bacterium]